MNINNVELEADFLDADFMERYEAAAAEMQTRANSAREIKWVRSSDAMKEICAYINEFFDSVFGTGTAEKIFGGMKQKTVSPDPVDEKGFDDYMAGFTACIPAQQAAVDGWKA